MGFLFALRGFVLGEMKGHRKYLVSLPSKTEALTCHGSLQLLLCVTGKQLWQTELVFPCNNFVLKVNALINGRQKYLSCSNILIQ